MLRPDLLASLVTFVQHHPSISYLFTGLFVGPTSQAPRVDEARHDALYELEIALARLGDRSQPAPPWQGDWLLRNLLVDVAGNGHRAEISIDKLFDWRSAARPAGAGGAARLRDAAPPAHGGGPGHPGPRAGGRLREGALRARRWCAGAPSCTTGSCCPFWLWRDMEDVLAFLDERGVGLPRERLPPLRRVPLPGGRPAPGRGRGGRGPQRARALAGAGRGAGRRRHLPLRRLVDGAGRGPRRGARDRALRRAGERPRRPAALHRHRRASTWAGSASGPGRRPSSLQPHLGIHHPLRFDLLDRWARRSVGACAYHVWHPEGRGYEAPPLTRFEATARRAARFTEEGPLPWPTRPRRDPAAPRVPPHPRPPAVRRRSPHARAGGGRGGALMQELLAECRAQDEVLRGAGLEIWLGAEPTFTDRASQDPHWLWMAEGGDKEERAAALLRELLGEPGLLLPARAPRGAALPGRGGAALLPGGGLPSARRRGERWLTVTPDPGVVEVNLAPAPDLVTFAEHVGSVYAAAAAAGLSPERFRWNGHAGDSGGGGQITLGGPSPGAEPLLPPPAAPAVAGALPEPPPLALLRLRPGVRGQRRPGAAPRRGGPGALRRAGGGARPAGPARRAGARRSSGRRWRRSSSTRPATPTGPR